MPFCGGFSQRCCGLFPMPVGLLLSTPLTVCLAVLGKYVSPFAFFGVILNEAPVEGLNTYYQRLVARDQDEATVITALKTHRPG
jgi:hypothetical protein